MERGADSVIGRFAPSPTGRMHLGNIYTALLSWLSAKSKGGRWLLRIEDLDPQRSRHEYAMQLMDDLHWLGLEWDGEPLWQSERTDVYSKHFSMLEQQKLVYPCYCSRADILGAAGAPHESDGRVVYPGTCRRLFEEQAESAVRTDEAPTRRDNGRHPAWRLIVPNETIVFADGHCGEQSYNLARQCGDFVVRRSDGVFAYQLAVVVDDALSGVTEVVRGEDLLLSTAQQIYLYRLFGYKVPHFCHLPLLRNAAGQRLSKRDKAQDMSYLRTHYTAEQIVGMVAYKAGLTQTEAPINLQELLTQTNVG